MRKGVSLYTCIQKRPLPKKLNSKGATRFGCLSDGIGEDADASTFHRHLSLIVITLLHRYCAVFYVDNLRAEEALDEFPRIWGRRMGDLWNNLRAEEALDEFPRIWGRRMGDLWTTS
ncbi:hypothetical protein QE152_g24413 [Popillia japonica]|uniref:Uncharacterized protein n=1 Tax=Popillia japonica TaxID=7064 RepID=A0AAW1KGN5_POPJA